MEKAITIKEAAAILGITPTHLYRVVAKNKIPHFRIGLAVRFLPSQLELFMRGKWEPKVPKRRPGRQVKVYPQQFDSETNPRLH